MTTPVAISVVIPCFNHGAFLPEAVASVTRLKRDDVELVVVDDGSTDARTHQEMDLLERQGIKVIRQKNKGLGAARNTGVRNASGEFILPLDSDNRLREAYLTSGIRLLQSEPSLGIVYGNAEYFGEKTGLSQPPDFDLPALVNWNYIDACALYRKAVWESVGGYDEKMPWMGWEDWDFWLRVVGRGWQFKHLPEIAYDYRMRNDSMLRAVTNPHVDELLAYVFGKAENRTLGFLRERNLEIERLRKIEKSVDYRLGRVVVEPVRKIRDAFGGRNRREGAGKPGAS